MVRILLSTRLGEKRVTQAELARMTGYVLTRLVNFTTRLQPRSVWIIWT